MKDRLPPKPRPGRRKDSPANALKARAEQLGHSGLYATKTPEELKAYIEKYSGSEKAVAYVIYGLTVNMMAMERAKEEFKNAKTIKKAKKAA